MKTATAIDIALACMDKEAQRLYFLSNGGHDKSQIDERQKIFDAMQIIKNLGSQGRMEL